MSLYVISLIGKWRKTVLCICSCIVRVRLVAVPCVRLAAIYSLVCGLPHCFVCGLIIVWNVSTTTNKCLGSVVEGGERKEGCGEMWEIAGGGEELVGPDFMRCVFV